MRSQGLVLRVTRIQFTTLSSWSTLLKGRLESRSTFRYVLAERMVVHRSFFVEKPSDEQLQVRPPISCWEGVKGQANGVLTAPQVSAHQPQRLSAHAAISILIKLEAVFLLLAVRAVTVRGRGRGG